MSNRGEIERGVDGQTETHEKWEVGGATRERKTMWQHDGTDYGLMYSNGSSKEDILPLVESNSKVWGAQWGTRARETIVLKCTPAPR